MERVRAMRRRRRPEEAGYERRPCSRTTLLGKGGAAPSRSSKSR